jgi:hypothetical protein
MIFYPFAHVTLSADKVATANSNSLTATHPFRTAGDADCGASTPGGQRRPDCRQGYRIERLMSLTCCLSAQAILIT